MIGIAPPQSSHLRRRPAAEIRTVCVVDPQSDEDRIWQSAALNSDLRVQVLASAEEALRRVREGDVDLWVINTRLPGISGFELCSMLKAQHRRAAVYLVADEYSPELECRAWQSRASMFAVKSQHVDLLRNWLAHASHRASA